MKILKNKKAVSPVISVVLLIGIAVAASALVYSWYAGMQKGTQEAMGETAARTVQATSSGILITNIEYPISNNKGINVTVSNIGSVNVTGLRLYADNRPIVIEGGNTYVNVGNTTNIWNTTLSLPSGPHTIKVTSQQGAEASQTLVI